MKKRALLFLIILGILILLPFTYNPLKSIFLFISRPFLYSFQKTGDFFENFLETIKSIKNLVALNEKLENEIRRLESEKARLLEVQKENEILKKQLGFISENKNLDLIPAYIIARGPTTFLQYLIINRGEKDGVKIGQTAILEGIVLGKVKEVNINTSKVSLITSPTSVVPAQTQESRTSGLVKGELGYGLILEDVPKEANLIEGENVITSGLGGDFPRGLLMGKIEKIVSSPADLFQKASLKPLIDFSKLEIIFIMK